MKTRNYELVAHVCWSNILQNEPGTELYVRQVQLWELYTEKLAMAQKPELFSMVQHERRKK